MSPENKLSICYPGNPKVTKDDHPRATQGGQTRSHAYQLGKNLANSIFRILRMPSKPKEIKIVKKNVSQYILVDRHLLQYGYTHPLLTCISGDQCICIMSELHEGICGSHIDGRALSLKAIWVGYYWSTMREDCMKYVKRCEQC